MRAASKSTWTPFGVAARLVIERVVVRNPHLAPTWIRLDPTAAHAVARLGIPSGEER